MSGSKPTILMTGAYPAWDMEALELEYHVLRLFEAADADAFIAAHAQDTRAIATRGDLGASAALMGKLPKLEIVSVFGVGTDAVDLGFARATKTKVIPPSPPWRRRTGLRLPTSPRSATTCGCGCVAGQRNRTYLRLRNRPTSKPSTAATLRASHRATVTRKKRKLTSASMRLREMKAIAMMATASGNQCFFTRLSADCTKLELCALFVMGVSIAQPYRTHRTQVNFGSG